MGQEIGRVELGGSSTDVIAPLRVRRAEHER